jgi:hypothetical protein
MTVPFSPSFFDFRFILQYQAHNSRYSISGRPLESRSNEIMISASTLELLASSKILVNSYRHQRKPLNLVRGAILATTADTQYFPYPTHDSHYIGNGERNKSEFYKYISKGATFKRKYGTSTKRKERKKNMKANITIN